MSESSAMIEMLAAPAADAFAVAGAATPVFPTVADPEISIIIPVHNQVDVTIRCLSAIAAHSARRTFEVLVVDDASDPLVFLQLYRVSGLRLVRNFSNLGFVRSCNRGAWLARGRFLVLLNNDTEVQAGWLDALVDVFTLRPDAGLAGAKLLNPDGTLQEAGGICWADGSAWNYGRGQDPTLPDFNYLRQTDYCSAAAVAIPRALWRQLNGFDEVFVPAYYEDTDLAFRVRAAGCKVYFQPRAVVVHHEGTSNGTNTAIGLKSYQVRNRSVFLERWQGVLEQEHRPNAVDVFHACGRTLNARTILIIDHYVPHPDRDAGSRSIMAYIQYFVDAGFSVKFVGDNHFPHQPYTENLQQLGVEVLVGPHFAATWLQWLEKNGRHIDYVLLSRAHISRRWLAPLRKYTGAPLLFYGHDLVSRSLFRAWEQFGSEPYLRQSEAYAEHERAIFDEVDWIFYPSQEEVDLLKERFPHRSRSIARIPLMAFERPAADIPGFEGRAGLLFVGGFGHHPNVDAIIWFVREVWPLLAAANEEIRLTIVGSLATAEILALANAKIEVAGAVSERRLGELYRSHRLSIVPLRYGGGIKGKILEAMHAGTPVVTTDIGAEGLLSTSGDAPHLTKTDRTPAGIAGAVLPLYADPDVWRRQQQAGWQFIREHYNKDAIAEALLPALKRR